MAEMRESNKKVREEALFVRRLIVERGLDHCLSVTPEQMETILELAKEYKPYESQIKSLEDAVRFANKIVKGKDFTVLHIDVSDALKGLKALRREANKTLKALEKVREATEHDVINFVTNVTMQDGTDSEQVLD